MGEDFATQLCSNILNPPMRWVGNRCYRTVSYNSTTDHNGSYMEKDEYPDMTYKDEIECGGIETDSKIERVRDSVYKTSIPVASAYNSYIIGAKGATKKRIEGETNTRIRIPNIGQLGDVEVVGNDFNSVRKARTRIELLIQEVKSKQPFTHFLSIPFNRPHIMEAFNVFKEEVLKKCSCDRGVEASIFQNASKLHITLCVMVLSDDRERREAVDALQQCRDLIINEHFQGEPMKVELRGLEYMNDDPSEVDVLYARVSNVSWAHSLQDLANALLRVMLDAGLATKQHSIEGVKLHATLMNTLFRNEKEGTNDENQKFSRETFDARRILEEFKNFTFGEMELSEIHLSIRHSTANNGYYTPSTKLKLEDSFSV